MKYKVGNKVKIKTWEKLEEEFGLDEDGDINLEPCFNKNMEEDINEDYPHRILEIKEIYEECYFMEDIRWVWSDEIIKCLVVDTEDRINSRFEILDIR